MKKSYLRGTRLKIFIAINLFFVSLIATIASYNIYTKSAETLYNEGDQFTGNYSGITYIKLEAIEKLDIVDEIDKDFNAIKGGGAALFREKIVADIAREVIWIYDESKDVEKLGNFNLPVEILPFGYSHTIRKMEEAGLNPVLRLKDGATLITDNNNFIVDLHLGYGFDIKSVKEKLESIVGVVEHGLFLNMCKLCIKGTENGAIIIENPNK